MTSLEPQNEREREDEPERPEPPFPTRFGRDARRRPRPRAAPQRAVAEPGDDDAPFEDRGGL
jgi:hypothetical protein